MKRFFSLKKLSVWAFFGVSFLGEAQNFQEILVPGAKCQDGSEYKFFLRQGNPKKILLHLDGGGACWDAPTCHGLFPYSTRKVGRPYQNGIFSRSMRENPVGDYTFVQFPYCTGDIFVGAHTAQYTNPEVFHWGRRNLERALRLLIENGLQAEAVEELVVHGSSAGALGVLLNFDLWQRFFKGAFHKSLVSDAPGLHFGARLWDRFSEEYMRDILAALDRLSLSFPEGKDTQVSIVEELCQKNPTWTFGVMQGQRDRVMSFFGKISQRKHRQLSLSAEGLHERLKEEEDNCASWMPNTAAHTFLERKNKMQIRGQDSVSALEFFRQILRGSGEKQKSYL